MEKTSDLLVELIIVILALFAKIDYWLDGVKMAIYESAAYREEAVALMDEDSALMREYRAQSGSLYEERNFTEILEVIHDAQAQSEAGGVPLPLWREMDAFYNDGLDKEQVLSDWINRTPDDWVPYAARAEYLLGEGWRARGAELAFKIPDEHFEEMHKAFAKSEKDLQKTIALYPAFSGSYHNYLELAKNGVGELTEREIMEQALVQRPGSYYLRYRYMETIEPKWGGSIAQMRKYALESQKQREDDPRVYQLLGYEYEVQAELATGEGNYANCVEYYHKANEYREHNRSRTAPSQCHEKIRHTRH